MFEDDSHCQANLLRCRPERRPAVVRGEPGRRQQLYTPVGQRYARSAGRLVPQSTASADAVRVRRPKMSRCLPVQRRRRECRQPGAAVERQSLAETRIYVMSTPILHPRQ